MKNLLKKALVFILTIIFTFGGVFQSIAAITDSSNDPIIWNESIDGHYLNGVTYGNGKYVAVGNDGALKISTDGITWTRGNTGTLTSNFGIVWNGSIFVIVGYNGLILTSNDAVTWTQRVSGTSQSLNSVIWDNSKFIAVGLNGTIVTSTDGITWSTTQSGTSQNLRSIAWSGSKFVIVGWSGSILTSTDGISWQSVSLASSHDLNDVTWGNGCFVAVGPTYPGGIILSSTDGINWTSRYSSQSNHLFGVTWGNNEFVVVGGNGAIITSLSGTSWNSINSGTQTSLEKITWCGNKFISVGESGVIIDSLDGENWNNRSQIGAGILNFYNDVIWGNNKFVVVGEGNNSGIVLTSSDGVSWASTTSGLDSELTKVVWGGNQYVAVGRGGAIFTSPDGALWTKRNSGTSCDINGIAWNGSNFTAIGYSYPNYVVLTSTDGKTWSKTSTSLQLYCIAADNNKFVAISLDGVILTSVDGSTWTQRATGVAASQIRWDNNRFVANVNNGQVFMSSDGINWSIYCSYNNYYNQLIDAMWTGKQMVGVGSNGTILTAKSSSSILFNTSIVLQNLHSVAYNGNRYVTVGWYNTVLTGTDVVPSSIDINGAENFRIPKTGSITSSFTATIKGQNGALMPDESVLWAVYDTLNNPVQALSINSNGVLTINNTAQAGNYIINAISNSKTSVYSTKTITLEALTASSININGSNSIAIPSSGNITSNFNVVIKDQENSAMTDQTVTWSVYDSDLNIVAGLSIDNNGSLRVNSNVIAGNYIVKAMVNAKPSVYSTKNITLTSPAVTNINISGPSSIIIPDNGSSTEQYMAIVVDTYSKTMQNETVSWGVYDSNANVASELCIDTGGILKINSSATSGTYILKAVSNSNRSVYATKSIELVVPVTDITLNKSSATVMVPQTLQLEAAVMPTGATDKSVTWSVSSGESNTLSVDQSGLVTAIKAGTSVVRVTSNSEPSVYTECIITTLVPVTELVINKTATIITPGQSEQLTVTVLPDNASNKRFIWSIASSSASNVATLDQSGLLTAINTGTVVVRATSILNSSIYAEGTFFVNKTVSAGTEVLTVGAGGNFNSMTAALAEASDGDTVALLNDITESVTYTSYANKTITLDGGGHTITSPYVATSIALALNGTGTIKLKDIKLQAGPALSGDSIGLKVSDSVNVQSLGIVNAFGGCTGGDRSFGAKNDGSGTVNITNATGGCGEQGSYGVYNNIGTINVDTATGGMNVTNYESRSYGVYNNGGTVNVRTAVGGTACSTDDSVSYGVFNNGGTVNVATATGGGATPLNGGGASYGVGAIGGTVNVTNATGGKAGYGSYGVGAINATVNVDSATGGEARTNSYGVYYMPGENWAKFHVRTGNCNDISHTNYNISSLQLNKGTYARCVLDSIIVAASGSTTIGTLPSVYKNGNFSNVWYTDSALATPFSGTTVTGSTVLYSSKNAESIVPVLNISLGKVNSSIISGQSEQLIATVSPNNASDNTVTWSIASSSSAGVAIVDQNGLVTANNPGSVVVRATSNADSTKYAECSLTVVMPVSSIAMGKSNTKIILGKTEQLTATISPDNASVKTVTWSIVSSSAANTATVDQNGLVTANNPGIVVVRATSNADSTKYADCSVTVVAANTMFTVNIGNIIPGGSITTTSTSTVAGSTINLTITPYTGMQLKAGTLKYNDGSKDYLINGTSFTMPASDVTVTAQFEQIPGYSASPESDFIFSNGAISGYKGAGGNVIIPSTIGGMNVYSIGSSAFSQCTNITSITVPNDVMAIGTNAFEGCSGLKNISLPDSLIYIGGAAFFDCSSLASVTIPNSVDSIGDSLFYGCSNLKSITLSNNMKYIVHSMFQGCSSLNGITIPNGVTTIESFAFQSCSNLKSVVIPNTVNSIENYSFSYCSSLNSVTISNGISTIGEDAFTSCSSLSSITIPNSVTSIGQCAFLYCSNLASVTMSNQITSINNSLFYGCSKLSNVIIPNSVTYIGNDVFDQCSALNNITIPSSVVTVGNLVFYGCSNLKTIYVPGKTQAQAYSLLSNAGVPSGCIITTGLEVSIYSLTVDKTSPQMANTSITWTCNAAGGTSLQYQFWVNTPGVGYEVKQAYSTSNKYSWTPTAAGDYTVSVWVKDAASKNAYDQYMVSSTYKIQAAQQQPVIITSITANKTSPQTVNTPITWTCNAAGGTTLKYEFWVNTPGIGYEVKQAYSTSNTYSWTPTVAGDYTVSVWVKDATSTNAYDQYLLSSTYKIQAAQQQPVTITSITANKTSPQAVNTPITWTCNAAGGTSLRYQFWVNTPGVGYEVKQAYSSSNTFSWTPTAAGDYTISVWVKDATSTNAYDQYLLSSTYKIQAAQQQPVTITSITANKTSPQATNTPITWTCNAEGGTSLRYQFWVNTPGVGYEVKQVYSTSNTFSWTPTVAGDYTVSVWVKDTASTNAYDQYLLSSIYKIQAAQQQPVTITSITANKTSPQAVNTPITWTCNAAGGTSLLYQFWVNTPGVGYEVKQAFSSSNTFSWTPTAAGDYTISVWVKDATSTNAYDQYLLSSTYKIQAVQQQPVTITSITANKTSPQAVNTPITWTCNAVGGTSVRYQFWVNTPGVGYEVKQAYSSSNTYSWTPTTAGDYTVSVWVKDASSTNAYDQYLLTNYKVQ